MKLNTCRFWLIVSTLFCAISLNAQSVGDYQTNISFGVGNWSALGTWKRWDGASWATPTALQGYPGQFSTPNTVTYGSFLSALTLDVSPVFSINNFVQNTGFGAFATSGNPILTVNTSFTISTVLDLFTYSGSGSLTVSGASSISGQLVLNGTGTYTFTGLVTTNAGGSFTSTGVTGTGNMIFKGGIVNNGTFSAGGATFNTSSQSISGSATVSFSGTVTVTGVTVSNTNSVSVSMTGTAAGTLQGNGTWTQGINSTLNYSGSTITVNTFNASNSGNTVNYNLTSGGQNIYSPSASTYYHLTLSGTGNQIKALLANTIVSGNLSIQNTARFSVSTYSLSVAGNWNNTSTNGDPFIEGTQTVTFNGSAAQTITNTGNAFGTVFNSLTLNNTFATSPQITISSGNVVVGGSGTLTMTKGNINLNGNTLTIGTTAAAPGTLSHAGASTNGWAYGGTFTRYFNTGTIANGSVIGFFPMGTSADFRPFYVSNPATGISTGGRISLTHTGLSTTSNSNITDGASTISLRSDSYWTCSTSGIVSGGNFNLNAGGTGFGTVGNVNDLRLCLSASVVGTAGVNSGTLISPMAQRTGLTTANLSNNFYIGSVNMFRTPLPIELISFTGVAKNYGVSLQWQTQSELNNNFFTVLHSTTGSDFVPVGTVAGNGTTNIAHSYTLTDYHPVLGTNYYKLQQTDFDGKTSSFEVIAVAVTEVSPIKIYPNPVAQSQFLHVEMDGLQPNAPAPLQVVNLQGISLIQTAVGTDENGSLNASLAADTLSPGVYILSIGNTRYRFVVR